MTLRPRIFSRRRLVAVVAGVGAMGAASAFAASISLPTSQELAAGTMDVSACDDSAGITWSSVTWDAPAHGFSVPGFDLTGLKAACTGKKLRVDYINSGTGTTVYGPAVMGTLTSGGGDSQTFTVTFTGEAPIADIDNIAILITD